MQTLCATRPRVVSARRTPSTQLAVQARQLRCDLRASSASREGPDDAPPSKPCPDASESHLARRHALLTLSAFVAPLFVPVGRGAADEQKVLVVSSTGGPGTFSSISSALQSAAPGATIRVGPGRYQERLLVGTPGVTIEATEEGAAVVVWETQTPYESVVQASAPGVVLRGLSLRHASKSVANNYGVYVVAGDVTLDRCDVSSSTGTGVAVEAAVARLVGCRVHDCKGSGVAAFGGLEQEPGDTLVSVEGCNIAGNGQSGVLVRAGAAVKLSGTTLSGNGQYGLSMQDADAATSELRNNVLQRNGRGAVQVLASFEPDAAVSALRLSPSTAAAARTTLAASDGAAGNSLDGPVAVGLLR